MRVAYIGQVRHAASVGEEEVSLPSGASVRDLLAILAERHGDVFREVLFESGGEVCRFLRVLVANTDINEMNGLDTTLDGVGDVALVLLVPQFAGG